MSKKKSTPQAEPVPEPAPVTNRVELFRRSLRVQLTVAEVADRADRAAHKIKDCDRLKEELKATTKHQKGIIEGIEGEVRQLSGEVRDHATYRMVDCQTVFDYATATVREVRLDTGEILNERRMTEAERQRELPFAENGQPAEAEGSDDDEEEEDAS